MLGTAKLMALVGTAKGEAAKRFYQDTLGLKLVSEDAFAFVFALGGGELRVARVPAVAPSVYAVLGFNVKDVVGAVDGLAAKGVKTERFPFLQLQQDEKGIWTSPDGARVAWFRDPDFNLLSVTQAP